MPCPWRGGGFHHGLSLPSAGVFGFRPDFAAPQETPDLRQARARPGGPRPAGTASLVGGLGLGSEPADKWLSDTPALRICGGWRPHAGRE